jgi:hypothetical protein
MLTFRGSRPIAESARESPGNFRARNYVVETLKLRAVLAWLDAVYRMAVLV